MFLLGDDPPRVLSTVPNLSLFKLILAMCKLVSLSMGEQELPRGQRLCWLDCWHLSFGLKTLVMGLDIIAAAAAASDCLVTAMLG